MRQPDLNITRARGYLLIVAILVLVVVAVAVAALGNMTSADIRASSGHAQSEQAYFAATSGIEYVGFQFGPGTACDSANINNVTAAVGQAQFTTTTQTYLASGATTTDSPLSASNATINVSINPITNGYAPHGRIWIDAEQINYTGRTGRQLHRRDARCWRDDSDDACQWQPGFAEPVPGQVDRGKRVRDAHCRGRDCQGDQPRARDDGVRQRHKPRYRRNS